MKPCPFCADGTLAAKNPVLDVYNPVLDVYTCKSCGKKITGFALAMMDSKASAPEMEPVPLDPEPWWVDDVILDAADALAKQIDDDAISVIGEATGVYGLGKPKGMFVYGVHLGPNAGWFEPNPFTPPVVPAPVAPDLKPVKPAEPGVRRVKFDED